jgi:hypothetical protein
MQVQVIALCALLELIQQIRALLAWIVLLEDFLVLVTRYVLYVNEGVIVLMELRFVLAVLLERIQTTLRCFVKAVRRDRTV